MRCAALAMLLVLSTGALSACGGGDGARREYTKADVALAAATLPRPGDVPADWQTTIATKPPCYDGALEHVVITGEAGDELTEQITYAAAGAMLFETRDTAAAAFEQVAQDKVVRCLADEFPAHLGDDDATVEKVSLVRAPASAPSARTAAWAITIRFTHGRFTPDGHVAVVLLQHGRTLAVLRFGEIANPFGPAVEKRLTRIVARRISN